MRVLVTGAASGIGRAVCLRLAREAQAGGGARIAACDLRAELLAPAAEELRRLGAEVVTAAGNLAEPNVPARLVSTALEAFGGLDALVSNAGVNAPARLLDLEVADWDRLFAVNTRATWLLAKAAYPALKAARGAIVATASISGMHAHTGLGAYGPSKAALIMLGRLLAQELGADGIRVNTVSPGFVHTGMTEAMYADGTIKAAREKLIPLGRVAAPEDIADVIAFLLSPDARYVTGQNLLADGGYADSFLDRVPGRPPPGPRS